MHHLILATLFAALTKGFLILNVDFMFVSSAILLLIVLSDTTTGFSLADISLDVVERSLLTDNIILSSSDAVVIRGLPDPFFLSNAPVKACTLIILYTVDLGRFRLLAIMFPEHPARLS